MKIDLLLDRLKNLNVSKLDDAVDRLNYVYTTFLLVFFTFAVGLQQTFSNPLNCKPEPNFPDHWVGYVDNYCYITGTYHTHNGTDVDVAGGHQREYLSYYQWVPYVLSAQALSFYLPHIIYLIVAKRLTGFNVQQVVERCHDVSEKSLKEIDKEAKEVAVSIYTSMNLTKHRSKSMGHNLVYIYLLSKLSNLAILAANIYVLDVFVGTGSHWWAFEIVKDAMGGMFWDFSGYFPRVSYCDINLRFKGRQFNAFTIQCLLMINILTEKVFVMLYFWFLAVFAISVFNFLWSLYKLMVGSRRPRAYIKNLECFSDKNGRGRLYDFWNEYLSLNGSLVLQFVEEHAGYVVALRLSEKLARLWMGLPVEEEVEQDSPPDDGKTRKNILSDEGIPHDPFQVSDVDDNEMIDVETY